MIVYSTLDEYIGQFPKDVAERLTALRMTIHDAAPNAIEAIKYGIPTFILNGNLVHFAAYKHHIGFYPTPNAIVQFQKELAEYEQAKGSVQFPLDKPLPILLIRRIVEFRVKQNLKK